MSFNSERKTEILATLGTFLVTEAYEVTKFYEYAAAFTRHKILPQEAKIELVYDSGGYSYGSKYVRIVLNTTIVGQWNNEGIGTNSTYWYTFFDTFSILGHGAEASWSSNGKVTIAPEFKVAQHIDQDGKGAFYSSYVWDDEKKNYRTERGAPMLRIVKLDGSPIGTRIGSEPFL